MMNDMRSRGQPRTGADRAVRHRHIEIDGIGIFYREAGREDAPAVLLPHGYPCSSYQFRNLMPALADRWHLVAPDFPGFGYSDTPEDFSYDSTAMPICSQSSRRRSASAALRFICTTTDRRSVSGWRSGRRRASRR